MRGRISRSMITVAIAAAAVGAVFSLSITRTSGQTPAAPPARAARVGGKPNLSGIWQANNEANWDLQAHAALPGAVTQPGVYPYDYARLPAAPVLALGAAGAVPGSLGVIQDDGQIPYKPEALAMKKDNAAHWIDRDPDRGIGRLCGSPRRQGRGSEIRLSRRRGFGIGMGARHLDVRPRFARKGGGTPRGGRPV